MAEKDFEFVAHTADIQVRVFGTTLAQFFRHALIAMFQAVGPRGVGCRTENERIVCDVLPVKREIEIEATDLEMLVVDFLSEALYLSDIHNEAYLDATVHEVGERHIRATVHGVAVTGFEVVELKAVTYHGLAVKKIDGLWQADIVFDI